jgi:hypothetical protein
MSKHLCFRAILFFLVTLLLLPGSSLRSETTTLNPSADTYVTADMPNTNWGHELTVATGTALAMVAYVKFNLGSIPVGATINTATLRLYCININNNSIVGICRTSSSWSEYGVTWNTPRPGWDLPCVTSTPCGTSCWWEIDVKSIVTKWVTYGESNRGFYLEKSSDGFVQFYSRELSTYEPQLYINYTPGPFSASGEVKDPLDQGVMCMLHFQRISGSGSLPSDVPSGATGAWNQGGFTADGTVYRVTPQNIPPDNYTFSPPYSNFSSSGGNVYNLNFIATPAPPPPPDPISAVPGPGVGQISLSWGASNGALTYVIKYDDDQVRPPWDPNPDGNPNSGSDVGYVTSVVIDGLTPGQTYYLTVAAGNAGGLGEYGDTVQCMAKNYDIDSAEIVFFDPPTDTVQRGTQAQAIVRIKNTGTTTRSFWVGLSLAESGATLDDWPVGWYDIPPQRTDSLQPEQEQTLSFNFVIQWWLVPGDYIAATAIWEGYNEETNLMVPPEYDRSHIPSFHLEAYDSVDVLGRRIYYPYEIENLPCEINQNFDNIQSWLESVDIVGPKVLLERIDTKNQNPRIKISVMKGNTEAIEYFLGSEQSQIILIVPNCYTMENLELQIDGTTTWQWALFGSIKTAFQILPTESGPLVWLLTGWLRDKLIQLGIFWGTEFLEPTPEYETAYIEDYTIIAVDFNADALGQDYPTFDEFDISFDINPDCENIEPISFIADLRYVFYLSACPRLHNSGITSTAAACGFQTQEFRVWVCIAGNNFDAVEEIDSPTWPSNFSLYQNYPNPFNPETKIEFSLPSRSLVKGNIYDILGRKVKTLVDVELSAGRKVVTWDGKDDNGQDVTSGVYFFRLRAGEFVQTRKMVLLR